MVPRAFHARAVETRSGDRPTGDSRTRRRAARTHDGADHRAAELDRVSPAKYYGGVLTWVTHNEKRILVGRFKDLTDDASLELIGEIEREILKQEPGSVLFLSCGTTSMNDPMIRRWREFESATASFVKATAVEGLPFFVRAVAKLMKRDMYFASSEEDALDWLARQ